MIILTIIVFLSLSQITHAVVSCSPSSCTPSCGSSCTYYTCSTTKSHILDIAKLPHSRDEAPSDACYHEKAVINNLPFVVSGKTYKNTPTKADHNYRVCTERTSWGSPCP